jgi:quercetin dioxygenase-like cupin family protein
MPPTIQRQVLEGEGASREGAPIASILGSGCRAPRRRGSSALASRGEDVSQFRRVVTGHDGNGHAIAVIDDIVNTVPREDTRFGGALLWNTRGFPVDNNGTDDAARQEVSITVENGTIFRIVEFLPDNAPRNHRTNSIDYAVVLTGEIDMELDNGVSVHLKAGDVLVQRGTIHNWINRGSQPCAIAFVLVDAEPVEVTGKRLEPEGIGRTHRSEA